MRTIRDRRPDGLTDHEVQALLRIAGTSSHGLAPRNYAMVQLILQAGCALANWPPFGCPTSR